MSWSCSQTKQQQMDEEVNSMETQRNKEHRPPKIWLDDVKSLAANSSIPKCTEEQQLAEEKEESIVSIWASY